MPHDRDGRPLAEGDVVYVPCRVTTVMPGEEWCNVNVETLGAMHPGDRPTPLVLNSRQVVRGTPPPAGAASGG